MIVQRRDKNEAELIQLMRGVGAYVQQMDKSEGFDLLVAFRGVLYAVEVKGPGKYRLTDNEQATREHFKVRDVAYNIVQDEQDVLRVLGLVDEAMPCGHLARYAVSSDEGTSYCALCELEAHNEEDRRESD